MGSLFESIKQDQLLSNWLPISSSNRQHGYWCCSIVSWKVFLLSAKILQSSFMCTPPWERKRCPIRKEQA